MESRVSGVMLGLEVELRDDVGVYMSEEAGD